MTTATQDKLFSLLLRAKQPWEAMPISHSPCLPGAESTIQRCLALRHLELPVGEWVTEASKRERERLGDLAIKLLMDNVSDEERHSEQLNYAFDAMKLVSPEKKNEIENEGKIILNRWLELGEKNHPALVAFVGEAGVFIPALTAFRRLGGVALNIVSTEISRDESLHLRAHKEVSVNIAREKVSSELDNLREETLSWLFQDLKTSGIPGKYGKKRTYTKSSHSLVYNGVAPELNETSRATMISFFEVQNSSIPVYGSK